MNGPAQRTLIGHWVKLVSEDLVPESNCLRGLEEEERKLTVFVLKYSLLYL